MEGKCFFFRRHRWGRRLKWVKVLFWQDALIWFLFSFIVGVTRNWSSNENQRKNVHTRLNFPGTQETSDDWMCGWRAEIHSFFHLQRNKEIIKLRVSADSAGAPWSCGILLAAGWSWLKLTSCCDLDHSSTNCKAKYNIKWRVASSTLSIWLGRLSLRGFNLAVQRVCTCDKCNFRDWIATAK